MSVAWCDTTDTGQKQLNAATFSLSLPPLYFSVKQNKEKDEEGSSQHRVTEIGAAPPPEKGEYPQIFGHMLRLLDVKVIKRQ